MLQRFLIANKEILRDLWCTGADLNTDNTVIHRIIQEDLKLKSGFHCLGKMLQETFDLPDQSVAMLDLIAEDMTPYFPLSEGATGFSVAQCCDILVEHAEEPRIMLQGFGSVGSSLAYFLERGGLGTVVGISGIEGFIYAPDGINIEELWEKKLGLEHWETEKIHFEDIMAEQLREKYDWQSRKTNESDEDFLCRFLASGPADVFSPCATRYIITQQVIDTLANQTFHNHKGYIVAGANNVFVNESALKSALQNPQLSFLPEWVSNCGNALLFMESLKTDLSGAEWVKSLKKTLRQRLDDLVGEAKLHAKEHRMTLYESIYQIIGERISKHKIQEKQQV